MKFPRRGVIATEGRVAPCAGAWIEIYSCFSPFGIFDVAPCAGAWIEILGATLRRVLPPVAPCAGAWIEIP